MAFELYGQDAPYVASSNVTTITWTGNPPTYASGGLQQYTIVVPDTGTGNQSDVKAAANANVMPIGVTQDGPAIGSMQAVRVRVLGYSKVLAGGAITVGAQLSANATGQAVVAAAAGATNTYLLGIAESAAAQAGDLVTVRLTPGATVQVNA